MPLPMERQVHPPTDQIFALEWMIVQKSMRPLRTFLTTICFMIRSSPAKRLSRHRSAPLGRVQTASPERKKRVGLKKKTSLAKKSRIVLPKHSHHHSHTMPDDDDDSTAASFVLILIQHDAPVYAKMHTTTQPTTKGFYSLCEAGNSRRF
jgi:hypothetical protein